MIKQGQLKSVLHLVRSNYIFQDYETPSSPRLLLASCRLNPLDGLGGRSVLTRRSTYILSHGNQALRRSAEEGSGGIRQCDAGVQVIQPCRSDRC